MPQTTRPRIARVLALLRDKTVEMAARNGVASLAYVAGIHVLISSRKKTWMAGSSPAMTKEGALPPRRSH
jgi:hypothetical protein